MKRKLIMNLQLFSLGGISRPLLEADAGAGNGGSGTGAEGSNGEGTGEGTQGNEGGEKSFDDVLKDKKYQSEFDKRVAKALETAKGKWETDYQAKIEEAKTEAEKLAKMNADQKAEYEAKKKLDDLAKREKDITTRELRATAYETLAEKNLPKELVDILNYSDAEQCNKSIEAVEKAFQSAVEKAVNDKLRGGNPPKGGQGNKQATFGFNFTGVRNKK
jgi:transketolase